MIQAESDPQKRDEYLQRLMELPNQVLPKGYTQLVFSMCISCFTMCDWYLMRCGQYIVVCCRNGVKLLGRHVRE